ncbi:hypothetical protein GB928_018500 [Shinella curvata]|uniref:Transposase n=1 Tax=Shinella curvata TaxID=1817964 RepID=A0ABT8XHM2_9HYPH|nr:hypothetical protein [Shinella curvata]MCJ8053850.1 hypothetical protein [Shinella curvata]MDO6123182.1 hypothetical protein [Shinella curvata]
MDDVPPFVIGVEKEQAHWVVIVEERNQPERKHRFVREEAAHQRAREESARLSEKYSG